MTCEKSNEFTIYVFTQFFLEGGMFKQTDVESSMVLRDEKVLDDMKKSNSEKIIIQITLSALSVLLLLFFFKVLLCNGG